MRVGYRNGRLYDLDTMSKITYAILEDGTVLSEGPNWIEVKETSQNGKPCRGLYDMREEKEREQVKKRFPALASKVDQIKKDLDRWM